VSREEPKQASHDDGGIDTSRLTTHDSRLSGIDPAHFRLLCGHFATGVTIVTTVDADGNPAGMTANSFASVSLEPPLVSVAIDHIATMYPVLRAATAFTINILESRQEALSRRFAESLPARFDGVGWHRTDGGHVVIDGSLAQLHCTKWAEVPGGDHTIFIGEVTSGAAAEHGRPLLHYRGGYAGAEGL
jgi:flavin reductase (DIM6/NTAB) family NADH-FMN oxidoreductase RutF